MDKTVARPQRAVYIKLVSCASLLLAAGCNRMADTPANYTTSLDAYFKAHPACLWSEDKKFPATADPTNAKEGLGYETLVDQGLLAHTSKPGEYDLTKKGKSALRGTPTPNTGNFCYGRRTIEGIDSSSPTTTDVGATTQVIYRYTIGGVAKWAKVSEVQTAFPDLGSSLEAPQLARATLTETKKGWQVTNAPDAHISTNDSKLIE